MIMLNDNLLLKFANGFYGYGNYHAPCWFLGMEEGGGNSVDEINHRFSVWGMRGGEELEDIFEYHTAIGFPEYFTEKPKIQNTWGKQIRFLFGVNGKPVDKEIVRNYQRDIWGRRNGNNCIIDLFPLPSASTKEWIYGGQSALEILNNREIYRNTFFLKRAIHIRGRINEFKPQIVCAFGITYMNYWETIVESKFYEEKNCFYTNLGKTIFVVFQHPAAFGATNEYFYSVGKSVARKSLRE